MDYGERGPSVAPGYVFIRAHLAVNDVGLGEIEKAENAFETVRRLIPRWVERRLRGEIRFRRREDVQRYTTLLRVAAGLEDPSAAEALRSIALGVAP